VTEQASHRILVTSRQLVCENGVRLGHGEPWSREGLLEAFGHHHGHCGCLHLWTLVEDLGDEAEGDRLMGLINSIGSEAVHAHESGS
jgi:hypothetical protein